MGKLNSQISEWQNGLATFEKFQIHSPAKKYVSSQLTLRFQPHAQDDTSIRLKQQLVLGCYHLLY